jgi:hypothetical protein
MLNPDGVANGYTRLDTNGFNLNAMYKYTNEKVPSIYALKMLIKYLSSRGVFHAYIDLHSHTTKRGIFFFSNPLTESNYRETLEIPYLFYLFQKQFSFKGSRFGVEKGEATSRKQFYKMTKCNRLYVLETNYWGESQPIALLKEKKLIKNNLRIVRNFGRFYNLPKFSEMGVNLARSIVKAGEMEMIRQMRVKSPQLDILGKDIKKIYLKLTTKMKKRKNKKLKLKVLEEENTKTEADAAQIMSKEEDQATVKLATPPLDKKSTVQKEKTISSNGNGASNEPQLFVPPSTEVDLDKTSVEHSSHVNTDPVELPSDDEDPTLEDKFHGQEVDRLLQAPSKEVRKSQDKPVL